METNEGGLPLSFRADPKHRVTQGQMSRIQAYDGPTASSQDKTRNSPNHQDETSQPRLPEDILCHIHSLMPMRDAAQVASVSRAFATSWRCRPNLTFSGRILGLNKNAYLYADDMMRDFTNKVDHILKHHSGIGVKTFSLYVHGVYSEKGPWHLDHLDDWLQIAVKQGIEELALNLFVEDGAMYNFPCSLFVDGARESLQFLFLGHCQFHPTAKLGCFKSLTKLQLSMVHITDEELGCFLASSFALETLDLEFCTELIFLKIPCLQRLRHLEVLTCTKLKAIESKAPKVSSFNFTGNLNVQLLLGKTQQIKKFYMRGKYAVYYAHAELSSRMPNLESLTVSSVIETVNAPMLPSKFLHLKFLAIALDGMDYDFLSLVSFFDASPCLETFTLDVLSGYRDPASIFDDPSPMRMMPDYHHDKLKRVHINNFSSARTLVELTCHIVESTNSLERLTLDTTKSRSRCSDKKPGSCFFMSRAALVEAKRALSAVQTYIKPKVPSTVELNVLEPCSRCQSR